MKHVLLLLIFSSALATLEAQNYSREAGIRGGLTSGFTYRQYLSDDLSYESILSFRQGGLQATILRQIHEPKPNDYLDNVFFVYGFGAHAGFYFSDRYRSVWYHDYYYPQREFSPVIGVDGYLGGEYRFTTVPISLGIDYKPFFEFSTIQFFRLRLWDFAFTAKYRF